MKVALSVVRGLHGSRTEDAPTQLRLACALSLLAAAIRYSSAHDQTGAIAVRANF